MAGIWVFAEGRDQTLELIQAGLELVRETGGSITAFATDRDLALCTIDHGADEAILLPPLEDGQPMESYVGTIAEAVREGDPDVFLVSGTRRGNEMAARPFSKAPGRPLRRMHRTLRRGRRQTDRDAPHGLRRNGCADRRLHHTPADGHHRAPHFRRPHRPQEGRTGKVIELSTAPSSAVSVISRAPRAREAVDITEAKIIVCVGRGFEKREDIDLARRLAEVLHGEVACSRPVAEDLRWLPEEIYLGISGKKVKPDLYLGLGVSGQIQHVTGIRDSKVIFAINRDENAPIFEAADFGIVGDLYQWFRN